MASFIITFVLGFIFIFLGVRNLHGDISAMHSYHTKRVSPEDAPKLGKWVGTALIIIAVSMMIFSVLGVVSALLQVEAIMDVGGVLLTVGLVAGSIMAIAATIHYNKGLF